MLPKSFYWLALIGLAAALQPTLAHAQGAPPALSLEEDRRRTLYQQGKEAIKAQRWADARAKLAEAWTIRASYDVALSLSQAEFNLERFAESAQYLAYYFRHVSAKENANNLANATQAFEAAKARAGSVQVTAPQGAQILVDGKLIGTAPLDTNAFVEPGRRRFEARFGEARAQQEVLAVAGEAQQLALSFPAPEESPTSAAAPPSAATLDAGLPPAPGEGAQEQLATRSRLPVYVGAGIAAAGLGFGIGFAVAAANDRDDIDALKQKTGPSGCFDNASADCAAQRDATQARDRHVTYEVISFSVAGAAVMGSAMYLSWPESSPRSGANRNTFHVSGGAARDGARIGLRGSF